MELTDLDFKNLRDYIQGIIGLSIQDEKKYLIIQRLEPVIRASKCKSYGEFYLKLKSKIDPEIDDLIIAAITTNETAFFRDSHPFDTFRDKLLPILCDWAIQRKNKLYARRGPKINIWCAAASTGQEPYTLAMIILDALENNKINGLVPEDFGILATDISSQVLARAISGRYDNMEVTRGVAENFRQKFFKKEENSWVIDESVQRLVDFRRVNLIDPFTYLGSFDMIFCRNVLIYFDATTRTTLFEQFFQILNPEGFLLLGASENTFGVTDKFISQHFGRTIVYKKKIQTV